MNEIKDKLAENTFQLIVGQYENIEDAVLAGNYDGTDEEINSQNFPWRDRPNGKREIILLEFDHEVSFNQAIIEAEKQGFARPDYEDALDFGEQFPEEQSGLSIVFLHEPWQDMSGVGCVLVLDGCFSGRDLSLERVDCKWGGDYRFAFIRK